MSVMHDSGEFKHSLMVLVVFIPYILFFFFFANADNVDRKQSEPVDFTFSFFFCQVFSAEEPELIS